MFKQPKIVQVYANTMGVINAVLYDDGRAFEVHQKHVALDGTGGHGYRIENEWKEIQYPIPRIPIPPEMAQRSVRPKTKRK